MSLQTVEMPAEPVFGFIGLGLIGGSVAHGIRDHYPGSRILAYDPDRVSLQEAFSDGVITTALDTIGSAFHDCDVVFLCAPVGSNNENLRSVKKYLRPDAILTDVGSVKTPVHRAVREEGLGSRFIGGHPMAGSERIGYRNSRALLLENAYYILTPEKEFPAEKTAWMEKLVKTIGAIPLTLSCEEHDFATAAISHVPHVISASLVNLVHDSDNADGIMRMIAAGGFKDITRISSSSPTMWQHICLSNPDNIITLLDTYIENLEEFRALIRKKDSQGLYDTFDAAREYRESFSETASGPIKKSYAFHVEIADRPGVMAEVVSILAINQINIKNIGITHNREYQEGVLRIELHDAIGLERARNLLLDKNYSLH